ncbi:MFS transporter [Streptomyces luteolus]|uniref:MFS transporter n=1 Tax=Streptomyces luteolus TaxID=3043615 RepID=A0ABT6T7U5_9ACTN|nr:MFS transporter [Streptomyces sp. B-S-A12]MDI3423934.1 MFS transporter [Streptomyces sp. B-S-A12]
MPAATARAGARDNTAPATRKRPTPRQLPALWLALLAAPVAAGANAPVLILPDMADSLGVRTTTATWLVTAFAWGMAVGTPLMAGLLRRRGPRTTLTAAALTVAAGTATVSLAPWLPLALTGRAAQAVGGAGLVAVAMNLAGTARRMGVITSGFGVLGAFGPLLGQTLTTTVSWRLSLAVSALALLAVPAVRRHALPVPPPAGPFDGRGATLLLTCVTALVLLPTAPLAALPVAAVAAPLLARHLRRTPDGFTPTALLRSRPFRTAAAAALTLSTSYFTLLFAVPELLADRTGLDTRTIGTGQLAAMLAGSALSWLLAAASPRLPRTAAYAILLGLGTLAAALAALATSAPLLLLATAAAIFTSTGANAVLSLYAAHAAPEHQRPAAIALFVLSYQLGSALGPALAALLVLG